MKRYIRSGLQKYSDAIATQFSEWVRKQSGVEDCGGDFNEYRNYIEFVIVYDDGHVNDTFGIDCDNLTGDKDADLDLLKSRFNSVNDKANVESASSIDSVNRFLSGIAEDARSNNPDDFDILKSEAINDLEYRVELHEAGYDEFDDGSEILPDEVYDSYVLDKDSLIRRLISSLK